ncbi:TatD family hydrolase [Prochlorothrix hollandica]|uniref:D-aminoacyl-tRNA deacylase n=1 Tax=Prochlorothrix hollandica PCC 9006 = CALU 1027 TaxID=317619 RepID=A0A0M2PTY3_PROHO|nr:TatD family hydrolase [Prochlorothrix hollandica]KKI98592.1 deoxyribonuclease [Prochlorothrix hollandica PCC 9006 = CALU 1027]
MRLIDTHVHINFPVFQDDLAEVAQRWRDAGIAYLIHSCVEPGEFHTLQALSDQFPELFFAVGLHPLDVHLWTPDLATTIQQLAQSDRRVVALGEMGLDFFKSDQVEQQYAAFGAQLRIARALDLPVIIHCRDAAVPMAEFLQQFWQEQGPVRGVMHCWGGSPEETQWFLDLGFYISFSGTVTFKKAEQIQASAAMVPEHRLLVETDCPFLAPVPQRGKRNEPAFVRHVAEQVATLRQVPLESLAAQTFHNSCQLFRLPGAEIVVA